MFLKLSNSGVDVPVEFTSFINSKFGKNLNTFSNIYVLDNPDRKYDEIEIKNTFGSTEEGSDISISKDELVNPVIIDWINSL